MALAALDPHRIGVDGFPLLLGLFLQLLLQVPAFHGQPLQVAVQLLALGAEVGLLHPGGLGADEEPLLLVVEEDVAGVGVFFQGVVERHLDVVFRAGEIPAHFFHQLVGFLGHPLFGDLEHVLEISLDGGLDDLVALDALELPDAEADQGGGGQNDGQLHGQKQPSTPVPAPALLFFHPEPLIPAVSLALV